MISGGVSAQGEANLVIVSKNLILKVYTRVLCTQILVCSYVW